MEAGIFKRVNFDFWAYLIFQERETEKRYVHSFIVTAPGHVIARETARDNCPDFLSGIERNKFLVYFSATKRIGAVSSDAEPGRCDYKGCVEITRQQSEYFATHQQMNP